MKRPTASIVAVTTNAKYAKNQLRVSSRLRRVASVSALGLAIGACALGFTRNLPAAPASAASAASAKNEVTADEIASRVQAFYDKTKTFRAGFKQTYFIRATGIEKKSNGDVTFAKPGKMSWRYKNNGNRVTSDGHVIRVYEQENKQMFESDMSKSAYPAALSFLVG